MLMIKRCAWVNENNPLYVAYHDNEWGVPCYDDRKLFAMLCLEGQQAGLSWEVILNKRAAYYEAFFDFDYKAICKMNDAALSDRLKEPGLVRNKLKLNSIRQNALALKALTDEGHKLSEFLWQFVNFEPVLNAWGDSKDIPASTPVSEEMSHALKKRGFKFVGPTICYAFMQAIGMVNDHLTSCGAYPDND